LGFGPLVLAINWTVSARVRGSCRTWLRGAAKALLESARARAEKAIVECMV
jgi:hypothetical protein